MRGSKPCTDHLGNRFNSMKDMCRYWGINSKTVVNRLEAGMSLDKALTTKVRNNEVVDHLGNKYRTQNEMCKHYGISSTTFSDRIHRGFSLEKALTYRQHSKVLNGKLCKDHLGNTYNSLREMCKHWGIDYSVFIGRMSTGFSLEKALTTPVREKNKARVDHLGNKFANTQDMCNHWKVNIKVFRARIKYGWSLEEALTNKKIVASIPDGFGNLYTSFASLANSYNKSDQTVKQRVDSGIEIAVALVAETPNLKLKFIGLDGKARYKITNFSEPLTARQIVEYYRPDLLSAYDKNNPTGKYEPYKSNKEGTTHE